MSKVVKWTKKKEKEKSQKMETPNNVSKAGKNKLMGAQDHLISFYQLDLCPSWSPRSSDMS